jgi:chemotaxis protein MotB
MKRRQHKMAKKLEKSKMILKETPASRVQAVYKPARAKMVPSHPEGHGGHDEGESGWIFSYADMITILMMFFILLLSISSLDEQKFQELKGAIASTTQTDSTAGDSGNLGESVSMSTMSKSEALDTYIGKVSILALSEKAKQLAASDANTQILAIMQMLMGEVDKEAIAKSMKKEAQFNQAKKEVQKLAEASRNEKVLAETQSNEIKVVLPSYLLFDAKGDITEKGRSILTQLSSGVAGLGDDGQILISSYISRMNQENPGTATLTSTTRARLVYDYLVAKKVDPNTISMAGYGNSKKLLNEVDSYGNTIDNVRKINDRVEILIRKRVKEERKGGL